MSLSPRSPRPFDHIVMPVEELGIARERLTTLGFTVAADAVHPFGTENACVFFQDGTYLEPLGINKREDCEAAALEGNVFVARDQAYRFRKGVSGFSGLAMGTKNGEKDHEIFVENGMSAGRMLKFSRPMKLTDGTEVEATFKLSYAADLRAPDLFGFTVERVEGLPKPSDEMITHENGVIGVAEVVLSETNPTDFQYFMQELINQREVDSHSFGMSLDAANAKITVLSKDGMKGHFGADIDTSQRGLNGQAVVFKVNDLSETEKYLETSGISYSKIINRLIVKPAKGQGIILAFQSA